MKCWPGWLVSMVNRSFVGLGYIDRPVCLYCSTPIVHSVVKFRLGLPVVSIITPAGGKGIVHTHTWPRVSIPPISRLFIHIIVFVIYSRTTTEDQSGNYKYDTLFIMYL